MALNSFSARHFGARTLIALAGLQVTAIPLPPVINSFSSGGISEDDYDFHKIYSHKSKSNDDEFVFVIVAAAMTILEQ